MFRLETMIPVYFFSFLETQLKQLITLDDRNLAEMDIKMSIFVNVINHFKEL